MHYSSEVLRNTFNNTVGVTFYISVVVVVQLISGVLIFLVWRNVCNEREVTCSCLSLKTEKYRNYPI